MGGTYMETLQNLFFCAYRVTKDEPNASSVGGTTPRSGRMHGVAARARALSAGPLFCMQDASQRVAKTMDVEADTTCKSAYRKKLES